MKYLKLFTLHNLALINDWLEESGSLFVDIYIPHNCGDSDKFFVSSIEELKQLIKKQASSEIEISIFNQKQFLLSGIADEKLIAKAITEIKDGEDYVIISLENKFPESIDILETGDNHEDLRKHLSKVFGRRVAVEIDSADIHWYRRNTKDVFKLSVTKNQNWYEKADKNLAKYKSLEDFWLNN
jgi:hypothetical protein